MEKPVDLKTRLLRCAEMWCNATGQSLTRLGVLVCNDGGFFSRVVRPEAGRTTVTLEKFARFFCQAEHWGAAAMPAEILDFAAINGLAVDDSVLDHVPTDTSERDQSSSGSSDGISPQCPDVNQVAGGALMPPAADGVASLPCATPEAAR